MVLAVAKWAGIILAGFVVLLLVLCLALLFAPVRYRIVCDTDAPVPVKIRFRFLFPLFYATLRFGALKGGAAAGTPDEKSGMGEKKLQVCARILGIKIFDLDKKQKKEDTKKKKNRKMHSGKKHGSNRHRRKKTDVKGQDGETIQTGAEKNVSPAVQKKQESDSGTGDRAKQKPDSLEEEAPGKRSIWEKAGDFFQKIKETFYKLCDIIKKYMEKKDSEEEEEEGIFRAVREKYGMARQMWEEKESKDFFAISKTQFQTLFRHIRPRHAKGTLQFGTGDPCMTGQMLGILSLFLPLYGSYMQVIPDFEQRCLQAEFTARGRIRLYKLLLFGRNWWLTDERRAWKRKFDKAM